MTKIKFSNKKPLQAVDLMDARAARTAPAEEGRNSTIEDLRNEIEGLKILMNNLFDFWELSPAERIKLAETISSGDFESNCVLLLSIHKFLGLLFPHNQEIKKNLGQKENGSFWRQDAPRYHAR
jgi:hypothetical protein